MKLPHNFIMIIIYYIVEPLELNHKFHICLKFCFLKNSKNSNFSKVIIVSKIIQMFKQTIFVNLNSNFIIEIIFRLNFTIINMCFISIFKVATVKTCQMTNFQQDCFVIKATNFNINFVIRLSSTRLVFVIIIYFDFQVMKSNYFIDFAKILITQMNFHKT